MEKEIVLSPKAQRQEDAMVAATERMRTERLQLEAKNRDLESLLHRKEQHMFRLQAMLAEAQAERQAIEAEYKRIHDMSPIL